MDDVGRLHGYRVQALDGEAGTLADMLVDDRIWSVRHLVVDTGGWLHHHRVLLAPAAVSRIDHEARRIDVPRTVAQLESCPPLDSDMPVSRQKELDYRETNAARSYWTAGYYAALIGIMPVPLNANDTAAAPSVRKRTRGDRHLRSLETMRHYDVIAADRPIGTVAGFEMRDWRVHRVLVQVGGWLHHHTVPLPPSYVHAVDWATASIHVDVPAERLDALPSMVAQ